MNRYNSAVHCSIVLKFVIVWCIMGPCSDIGVDLAGLLGGGAWRAPKVGRCRVGWGMGRGVLSSAD